MPTVRSSLLRERPEWALLANQVLPAVLASGQTGGDTRAWTPGGVGDAIAVAVAYCRFGGSRSGRLLAFAGSPPDGPGPVAFPRSEIRVLRGKDRASSFVRRDEGWVPAERVARDVVLSRPSRPVDLVTLGRWSGEPVEAMVEMLRPGGYLVIPKGSTLSERWEGCMEPAGPSGRVFRRSTSRQVRRCGRGLEEQGETLVEWQEQFELFSNYANLARSLARRFSGHGETRQDLVQVAMIGLVLAAKRFDPGMDASFSTFATATILGELKRHFRDKTWMLKVPRSLQETYLSVKNAREILSHELSRSPTITELAERLQISEERVLQAMEAGDNYLPESLDLDVRRDETSRDIPVQEGGYQLAIDRCDLARLIPRLPLSDQVLLQRLYFDGWTQRQAAEEMGVSQMQVSRVLSRTLANLRTWSA